MERGVFVAAVLGRYWYHQSRRYLLDVNTATSMKLGQRVASLVVDVALCPGLARFRDAARAENMLALGALSRADGRSRRRRRFHPAISSRRLVSALALPITITPHTRRIAMLAVVIDVLDDGNAKVFFSSSEIAPSSALVLHHRPSANTAPMPLDSLEQCCHYENELSLFELTLLTTH